MIEKFNIGDLMYDHVIRDNNNWSQTCALGMIIIFMIVLLIFFIQFKLI